MIETLQSADASLFTALNSLHAPYFDQLQWLISGKFSWLPMVLMLLYILSRKGGRQACAIVVAIALVVLLADQISSSLIKPLVERLRPSHDPSLTSTIHIVNDYRGGSFGFVSSHAANCFGVALLLCLLLRGRVVWCTLMAWATIVSYSRIYLGVHFPGDILCGALVGAMVACLVYRLWLHFTPRWSWAGGSVQATQQEELWFLMAGGGNLLILVVVAFFML